MEIDYNVLSKDYDLTRGVNVDLIKQIVSKASVNKDSCVLDFGCGTGNYAHAIKKLTGVHIFGVEPSDGMREKAQEKSTDIEFKKGDHTHIPFTDGFFDLIYMTDVIHHVPNIDMMFAQFFRVLKESGLICIITESHEQIETRFWSAYFPATVPAEKNRYPNIPNIIAAAQQHGFSVDEIVSTSSEQHISADFITLVENKGYSMFRLISDDDFSSGLKRLKEDFENQVEIQSNHGETLLWLNKK